MALWLTRYRHGRGFGVHSPFAFRFITGVLRERLPYYDYARLKGRTERLYYRIGVALTPRRVVAAGTDDCARILAALRLGAGAEAQGAPMYVSCGRHNVEKLEAALAAGSTVVLAGKRRGSLRSLIARLDAMGYGMAFYNRATTAILIPNPKLPRQNFATKF